MPNSRMLYMVLLFFILYLTHGNSWNLQRLAVLFTEYFPIPAVTMAEKVVSTLKSRPVRLE